MDAFFKRLLGITAVIFVSGVLLTLLLPTYVVLIIVACIAIVIGICLLNC